MMMMMNLQIKSQVFVVLYRVNRKRFDLSQASVTFIFRVHQLNVLFLTDGP